MIRILDYIQRCDGDYSAAIRKMQNDFNETFCQKHKRCDECQLNGKKADCLSIWLGQEVDD